MVPTFPAPRSLDRFLHLGYLGVRVFFVISGYLITSLLLKEADTQGCINLRKFYYRRALRIFPPFYVFMAIVLFVCWLGLLADVSSGGLRGMIPSLFYLSNYLPGNWYSGHSWSLSVEEQFYLLWPLMLLTLGRRRSFRLAASTLLIIPMIRLGYLLLFHAGGARHIGSTFETAADAIATGCVLAAARQWLQARPGYAAILRSKWFWIMPGCVMGLQFLFSDSIRYTYAISITVGYTLMNIGIALTLDRVVTYPNDAIGRLLNSRPLVSIGIVSYSIYLWQQIFLSPYDDGFAFRFPINLAFVALASTASYFLIERPALRLRQRWEPRLFASAGQQHPRTPHSNILIDPEPATSD